MIGGLLCRLGRHDGDPHGRWNGGYCFTRCRRCGRDMVRSAFGEWHVPKGYRVVWGPPGSVADLDEVLAGEGGSAAARAVAHVRRAEAARPVAPAPPVDELWPFEEVRPVTRDERPAALAPVSAPVVDPAPAARPRRPAAPSDGNGGRSPFDFGDFDQIDDRPGGNDPFAPPPELRRRAPPA